MKKELFLLLFLSLLIFASKVFSQNETISEEGNTTTTLEGNKTLVTEENKTKEEPPKIIQKPEVNPKCEGRCLITIKGVETCLDIGSQIPESEGGSLLYCSSDKKLETAKETGENCNNDYECLTYTCDEGVCFEEQEEGTGIKSSQIMLTLVAVIFAGGLTFLALKFLSTKKAVVKEEKKTEKKGFEIQEPEQKYSYKYKPEFDVLEKKLKESLGKIKNK